MVVLLYVAVTVPWVFLTHSGYGDCSGRVKDDLAGTG